MIITPGTPQPFLIWGNFNSRAVGKIVVGENEYPLSIDSTHIDGVIPGEALTSLPATAEIYVGNRKVREYVYTAAPAKQSGGLSIYEDVIEEGDYVLTKGTTPQGLMFRNSIFGFTVIDENTATFDGPPGIYYFRLSAAMFANVEGEDFFGQIAPDHWMYGDLMFYGPTDNTGEMHFEKTDLGFVDTGQVFEISFRTLPPSMETTQASLYLRPILLKS